MKRLSIFLTILVVSFVVFVFVAFQARTYQRDFIFQMTLLEKLNEIGRTQQETLQILKGVPRPGERAVQPPARPVDDPDKIYTIDLTGALFQGDPQAKITIVEFSDIQCPFSQRFHPIFMDALASYPKDVKYVFKNFPLSFSQSRPAAKALLAAKEQGKYWEMLGLLMESGRDLSSEKYLELAKQIDLNVDQFQQDLENKDAFYESVIQKDVEAGMAAEVQGTPTFYINGKKTQARTLEDIKKEIDLILNEKFKGKE